jgi:fructose-1,6-bisphosphatase I
LATDGKRRILDITPTSLHARVPFCFGSPQQMAYFSSSAAGSSDESSPLFSDRGFFRKGS